MSTILHTTKATRLIARAAVATLIGVTAVSMTLPASAETSVSSAVQAPYNNCPGTSCIIRAEIDTSGPTVKFHGETAYTTSNSQWYLTLRQNGTVVKTLATGNESTNRLDADLGLLPAGGAYDLAVLAGTPFGDQLLYRSFTTGPVVTATPTATNVKLAFSMPVGVTAQAYIRKPNGTIVASATSTGASATHTLVSGATLNPTTTYTYQVNATDAQGRVYTKVGTFQTRNVRLEVQLSSLKITNDSDSFGAGELRAQLHLGATKKWIWQSEKSVETAWGSKYYSITTAAALPSAVRTVPISVVVNDDDCEGVAGSLCSSGWGDLSVGSGTLSDQQWATATVTATLPNTTTTTQWTYFTKSVTSPVGFTVTGSYRWVMV